MTTPRWSPFALALMLPWCSIGCRSETTTSDEERAVASERVEDGAARAGAADAAAPSSPAGSWVLDNVATLEGFDRFVATQLEVVPEAQRAAAREILAPQRQMLAESRIVLTIEADGRFGVESDAENGVVQRVEGRWELDGDRLRMVGGPVGVEPEALSVQHAGDRITLQFGPPGQKVSLVFVRR